MGFDLQFIAFNELLHSDVNKIDRLLSWPTLSYLLSLLCLVLLNIDLLIILRRFSSVVKNFKSKKSLSEIENEDKNYYLEDIKKNPEMSDSALSFNINSMLRFTIFQIFIASLQLSPILQNGFLVLIQLIFVIFYFTKQLGEGIFSSWLIIVKTLIFEVSILIFLVLSCLFSFETSHSWFSAENLAGFQTLAVVMILLSIFVEFITLVVKVVARLIETLKKESKFRKKKKTKKLKDSKYNEPKEQNSVISTPKASQNSTNFQTSWKKRNEMKKRKNFSQFWKEFEEESVFKPKSRTKHDFDFRTKNERKLGHPPKVPANMLSRQNCKLFDFLAE